METIEYDNSSPAVRVESADSSRAPDDQFGVWNDDPLRFAQEFLERAQDRLRYGRRQEAEEALELLKDAATCVRYARQSPAG